MRRSLSQRVTVGGSASRGTTASLPGHTHTAEIQGGEVFLGLDGSRKGCRVFGRVVEDALCGALQRAGRCTQALAHREVVALHDGGRLAQWVFAGNWRSCAAWRSFPWFPGSDCVSDFAARSGQQWAGTLLVWLMGSECQRVGVLQLGHLCGCGDVVSAMQPAPAATVENNGYLSYSPFTSICDRQTHWTSPLFSSFGRSRFADKLRPESRHRHHKATPERLTSPPQQVRRLRVVDMPFVCESVTGTRGRSTGTSATCPGVSTVMEEMHGKGLLAVGDRATSWHAGWHQHGFALWFTTTGTS